MSNLEFISKTIVAIFVFCVVLFVYLHIDFHYRTSSDLEFYQIDITTKEKLEEICNLKQPFSFSFHPSFETNLLKMEEQFLAFEVNVKTFSSSSHSFVKSFTKEEKEKENIPRPTGGETVPLPLENVIKIFQLYDSNGAGGGGSLVSVNGDVEDQDKAKDDKEKEKEKKDDEDDLSTSMGDLFFSSSLLSEENQEFLEETGFIKKFKYNDHFFRPFSVSQCLYDMKIGCRNSCTPLRYDISHRNYFYVTEEPIQIVLIPPKYSKFLFSSFNAETLQGESPINVWKVDKDHQSNYKKTKKLIFTIPPNTMIYIPPYWWFSFRFSKTSSIASFHYRTWMSNLAILPFHFLSLLQKYNTKRSFIENKWSSSNEYPNHHQQQHLSKSKHSKKNQNQHSSEISSLPSSNLSTFDLLKLKLKKL